MEPDTSDKTSCRDCAPGVALQDTPITVVTPASEPSPESFPPPSNTAQQQSPAALDSPSNLTPAMQVRLSLARRVILSFTEAGTTRRRLMLFWVMAGLIQVVAWAVILALYGNDPCDSPARAYLVLTCIRHGLSIPLSIYNTLIPQRPRRTDSAEQIAEQERSRRVGSPALDARTRSFAELLNVYALAVFCLGNWWYFNSSTCSVTAPALYSSMLAALILSWIYCAQIILVVLAVMFALPLLLLGFRIAGVTPGQNEVGPLDQKAIDNLPRKVYLGVSDEPDSAAQTTALPQGSASKPSQASEQDAVPSKPSSSTRQFWRLWRTPRSSRKRKSVSTTGGKDSHSGIKGVRLPESQSACSICLCEYDSPAEEATPSDQEQGTTVSVEPDILIQLPRCGHCFHQDCLKDWLRVSGRCPLCQVAAVDDATPSKQSRWRRRGDEESQAATAVATVHQQV